MKRTLSWFIFSIILLLAGIMLAVTGHAQTAVVFNENTTVRTGVNPFAMVVNLDQTNTEVLKNGISLNPGVEKSIAAILIQVGQQNVGSATYFNDFNDFAIVLNNEFSGASYRVWRAGTDICDGTVNSNNQGDSNSAVFTATLSGTSLSSISPSSATLNGIGNGTFNLEVHRGGGSGATATMTCAGATGSPLTGASCVPSVTAGGTGYTSVPTINIWNGFTLNACTTGTWAGGATVGDYVAMRQDYGPSTQAMLNATGWGFSGAGSAVGETSDLPNDSALGDLPPGSGNGQAMLVTGPMTIGNAFDTGIPAQNLYVMTDPITANVTMKGISGSGNVSWSIARATAAGSGTGFSCSGTITPVNGTWTWFSNYTSGCTTGETVGSGTGPIGQVNVNFTIPSGTVVEMDNFYVAAASTGNTTAFRDPVVATLQAYGGISGAPTRVLNNQMPMTLAEQLQPDNRSVPSYSFGDNCNNGQPLWSAGCIKAPPITWPQHLNLCEKLNDSCWDVVGVNWSSTDAQTVADYLGGGCSTTGGAIRCAQGHTTPYTTTLAAREIFIEPGNENWNLSGSGGKWRTVPQCSAGPNCSSDYASGVNTNAPYGFYVQNLASNFQGQASYSSNEKIVLGLQTSGNNTTFGSDNLFKSTSTAGTPFVTASSVGIDFAPYIDFNPTSAGFDISAFSNQIQTDLANAYWSTNVTSSNLYIPAAAYPSRQVSIYEMNGGMTGLAATGVPTQAQANGYQNSLGGGLADMLMMDEGCTRLNICDFRAHFVLLQQQQGFNNIGTTTNVTGTSANGSNVITGVAVTANMVPGQSFSGPGLSSSSVDSNGTALIWFVGANTLTLSRNTSCSTTCGSNTFTMPNIVVNLWGGAIGSGAQTSNRIRPFMQLAQNENAYAIPYGAREFQSSYTSPVWNFPRNGTCPTFCNGVPTTTGIPLLNIYARCVGVSTCTTPFRSYTFYNTGDSNQVVNLSGYSLMGTVTMVQTGSGLNWTDTNEAASNVVPVMTSVAMPSSLTLPAHSQTILSGNIGSSSGGISIGGNIIAGGNVQLP